LVCHINTITMYTADTIYVSIVFTARSKLRKVLFLALSTTFCFFVCESNTSGTAERICAKFTLKTFLVPRSDEFECQGQMSTAKVTTDKKRAVHSWWTDQDEIRQRRANHRGTVVRAEFPLISNGVWVWQLRKFKFWMCRYPAGFDTTRHCLRCLVEFNWSPVIFNTVRSLAGFCLSGPVFRQYRVIISSAPTDDDRLLQPAKQWNHDRQCASGHRRLSYVTGWMKRISWLLDYGARTDLTRRTCILGCAIWRSAVAHFTSALEGRMFSKFDGKSYIN